jgi:hypothetical protein
VKILQVHSIEDWAYVLDSSGRLWERPFTPDLPTKWERIPPLPGLSSDVLVVESFTVTPIDGVIFAVAGNGTRLFRYLTIWEEITPPFAEGMLQ